MTVQKDIVIASFRKKTKQSTQNRLPRLRLAITMHYKIKTAYTFKYKPFLECELKIIFIKENSKLK